MARKRLTQVSHNRRRPQVPRVDELAAGVAAPGGNRDSGAAEALRSVRRTAGGQVATPEDAARLGRLGGLARAEREKRLAETPQLARGLGLRDVKAPELLPYLNDAAELAEHECARLARIVGGGECGTGPALIVSSAALQIAGSRFAFARGDVVTGSRLGDAARANLMSAHDLCALEAEARARSNPRGTNPVLARIEARADELAKEGA